jgi:hypothetical protein
MKNNTISFAKVLPFTIPIILMISLILIIKSSFFMQNSEVLSSAITIDFLLVIPLVYFLLIRKKDIPKITVLTSFVLGLVLLSYFLPSQHQSLLSDVKTYFLPVLELGVVSFILYKVSKLRKSYRNQQQSGDFYATLKIATEETLPKKVALILATEISVIYYGFLKWKRNKLSDNEFTYHKSNGLVSMIIGLTMVIAIETIGLHSILTSWNPIVGWIITFLSAYTGLQFFALAKSVMFRPHQIDLENKMIHLKFGNFTDLEIPFDLIRSITIDSKDLPEDKSVVYFSPIGALGGHNMILHLKEEIQFSGIYGIKRKAKSLAIHIDEKGKFHQMVENSSSEL